MEVQEIQVVETNRLEEILQEQLEILKEEQLSEEEKEEIEQEKIEQQEKQQELEEIQKDFINKNLENQTEHIEKIDLLIEVMTDIQDDIAEYNKNNVEGFWFLSITIVLALGLKYFMSEITKW